MKTNKYLSLIKNTGLFAIGILGAKFVQFLLLPFFTNILTPEEYGTIDLVITFVNLLVPILTFNLADAILRFGLSPDVKKTDVLRNGLIILGISAILTIILSPCLNFFAIFSDWKIYIILMIIVQGIRLNFSLYIKSEEKLFIYSLDSILCTLSIASFDIILISYFKLGIQGYFMAEIVGNIVSILFLILKGSIFRKFKLMQPINQKLLEQMLKYSLPLMLNAISWWITNFSDRIILNLYRSEGDVGLYSVAAKMPAIVTTGISVFTQAWIMSSIIEYDTSRDTSFFKKVYCYYNAGLSVAISVVILLVEPFMNLYVGHEFLKAWKYVPFLLIGTIYLGISNYFGAFYSAAKENIKEMKSTLICAVSNIILNFILIPKYGIMGAVLATMLSYIIIVFVRIRDTKKILNLDTNIFLLLINMLFILFESLCVVVYSNYILAFCSLVAIIFINGSSVIREYKKTEQKN